MIMVMEVMPVVQLMECETVCDIEHSVRWISSTKEIAGECLKPLLK